MCSVHKTSAKFQSSDYAILIWRRSGLVGNKTTCIISSTVILAC